MKAIKRFTNRFPDGSNGIFSVGCGLTTLSAPTIIPGRSRKLAPCSNTKLKVVQGMAQIQYMNLIQNTTFRLGI